LFPELLLPELLEPDELVEVELFAPDCVWLEVLGAPLESFVTLVEFVDWMLSEPVCEPDRLFMPPRFFSRAHPTSATTAHATIKYFFICLLWLLPVRFEPTRRAPQLPFRVKKEVHR